MKLLHFSENPDIELFEPHVARTAVESEPLVWAVDETHAPSYWFPRECPRACCWIGDDCDITEYPLLELGGARRLHAIEAGWLSVVRDTPLYAYEFAASAFSLQNAAAGYWVAH